jgi:hypothetical protein
MVFFFVSLITLKLRLENFQFEYKKILKSNRNQFLSKLWLQLYQFSKFFELYLYIGWQDFTHKINFHMLINITMAICMNGVSLFYQILQEKHRM